MAWNIPKVWKDGRCIIIGGGPSVMSQFDIPQKVKSHVLGGGNPVSFSPYMESIHGIHIIAVNQAFRLGNWIDVLFFGDGAYFKKNKDDILHFPGLRVTSAVNDQSHIYGDYNKRLKFIVQNSRKREGITFKQPYISWNWNSGAAAINLAYHFGVKHICLLGFDMVEDEQKNKHWHKLYGNTISKSTPGIFRRHAAPFPLIAEDLKGKVEVFNASPESKLECFTKGNLKEWL